MVMADLYDQRTRKRQSKKERQKSDGSPQITAVRIPTILSKNSTSLCDQNEEKTESLKISEKISVLSKTMHKEEAQGAPKKHSTNGLLPDNMLKSANSNIGSSEENHGGDPLTLAVSVPAMTVPIKLINGLLKCTESGSELMMEQTNYLVVGVLGLQNVGKSTILSYLGDIPEKNQRLIFKPQTKGTKESGVHVTTGIDMFITKERMILLDCQALLSISGLIDQHRHEKKHTADFTRFDAGIDIQSLQLVAFMMSVCNYVIVVMDWFADDKIFEILRLAEMLKPHTIYEDIQREERTKISSATLIFTLNKAGVSDHEMKPIMEKEIEKYMEGSRLNFRGILSTCDASSETQRVNLTILPHMAKDSPNKLLASAKMYGGCMEFDECIKSLGYQLLAMPRKHPINKFSEKKWLMYASRTWDMIKKSQLMSDYGRLLS